MLINNSETTKNGENTHDYRHTNKKSEVSDIKSEKGLVVRERNAFEDYDREIEKNINQILNKLRHNTDEFAKIDRYVKELRETSLRVYNQDNKIYSPTTTATLNYSTTNVYKCDSMDIASCMTMLNLPNSQLIHDCLLGDVEFRRPYDHRIEDTDLTVVFETLNIRVLLQIFGSLLLERKVVLVSKCLR